MDPDQHGQPPLGMRRSPDVEEKAILADVPLHHIFVRPRPEALRRDRLPAAMPELGGAPDPRPARDRLGRSPAQRGPNAKAKKKEAERPRGPLPLKNTGRSFSLDDESPDESRPDIDDFATSKPTDETDKDDE